MSHFNSYLPDDRERIRAFALALAITVFSTFAATILPYRNRRVAIGNIVMFLLRPLALAFGWAVVAMLFLPIQLLNILHPHQVPYLQTRQGKAKTKIQEIEIDMRGLSRFKVSDYDFSTRFSPAVDDHEKHVRFFDDSNRAVPVSKDKSE